MKFNESLLIEVLSQQSYSGETKLFRKWIQQYVRDNIEDWKMKVDNGNLYVTKGKIGNYPCVVSHIDTVHKVNHNVDIFLSGRNLFAFDTREVEQYGIGGDDKVGVFMCLQMLHDLPNVKVAFFRDEETGCKGSMLADKKFFSDCAFVLQCDRRGHKDFVNEIGWSAIASPEWNKAILPIITNHAYKFADGMMTDVEALKKKGINLCMANMSCGYYNPHTSKEYVNIDDVEACYNLVHNIIKEMAYQRWIHKYAAHTYTHTQYNHYGYDSSDGYYNDWEYDTTKKVWVSKKVPKSKFNFHASPDVATDLSPVPTGGMGYADDKTNKFMHGKRSTGVECPVCKSFGLIYDMHERDWFCDSCSMYYGQALQFASKGRIINDGEKEKSKKDNKANLGSITLKDENKII